MEIKKEYINAIAVLSIAGRLNVTTTAELEDTFAKISEENTNKVLVDCVELEYISSAGLRVLLAAAKNLKKSGGEICLSGMNPNVKQVFEISGFTNIFKIYTSKDDAITAMSAK